MRESVQEWRARKLAEKNEAYRKRLMRDATFWGIMMSIVIFCVGALYAEQDVKSAAILMFTGMCTALFCSFVRIWWT